MERRCQEVLSVSGWQLGKEQPIQFIPTMLVLADCRNALPELIKLMGAAEAYSTCR